MTFKLVIECSKDIDKLKIDFSDGSSCVSTKPVKSTKEEVEPRVTMSTPVSRNDAFIDLDADFGGVSQEVVQKPDVTRAERPVKVAEELQNLNI